VQPLLELKTRHTFCPVY